MKINSLKYSLIIVGLIVTLTFSSASVGVIEGGLVSVCAADSQTAYGCDINQTLFHSINESGFEFGGMESNSSFSCDFISCASDGTIYYILNETWMETFDIELHTGDYVWVSASTESRGTGIKSDGVGNFFGGEPLSDSGLLQTHSNEAWGFTLSLQDDNYIYVYAGYPNWGLQSDQLEVKYFGLCKPGDIDIFVAIGTDEKMYAVQYIVSEGVLVSDMWQEIPLNGDVPTVWNGFDLSNDASFIGLNENVDGDGNFEIVGGKLFDWTCNGTAAGDAAACSGYGICVEQDNCQCYPTFSGSGTDDCSCECPAGFSNCTVTPSLTCEIVFPLCNESTSKCVQVNLEEDQGCYNCNYTSLQDAINSLDASGGYTIYLVGSLSGGPATLTESVSISTGTPEDITLTNTIIPYPTTSVQWVNDGDASVLNLNTDWWRVTGEGGYLEIVGDDSLSSGTKIIYSTAGGLFLDNFILTNNVDSFNDLIKIEVAMGTCKGVMLDSLIFTETWTSALNTAVVIDCQCNGGCSDTSYTDEYGTDRRIWMKNSEIKNSNVLYALYSYSGIYFEKNYIKVNEMARILVFDQRNSEEEIIVTNNVIHLVSTTHEVNEIMNLWNYKEGVLTNYGYLKFFNNLIYLEDEAKLWTILDRQAVSNPSDCDQLPIPSYIYNNLIRSTSCFQFQGCEATCSGGDPAHLYYKYNYFYSQNETCNSFDFGDHGGSCDDGDSIVVNDGYNDVGWTDGTFYLTGDVPAPYFDLQKETFGMPLSMATSAYVLPGDDFSGRVRGTAFDDDTTSVGAFEFYCPSNCLSPFKTWCHNAEDCSCLAGYYGSGCSLTSPLFEYQSGEVGLSKGNYSSCGESASDTLPSEAEIEGWPGSPGGRSQTGGAIFGSVGSEVLYVFGGYGFGEEDGMHGVLGDLWSYDISRMIWCYIKGPKTVDSFENQIGVSFEDEFDEGHLPGSRSSYSYFSTAFSFFMFGGMRSGGYDSISSGTNNTNEVWEVITKGHNIHNWRLLQPEMMNETNFDQFPSPRSSSCAAKMTISDTDPVYVFGGGRYDYTAENTALFNDLWEYDIQMNTFSRLRPGENTYKTSEEVNVTELYDAFGFRDFSNQSMAYNPPARYKHTCWVGLEGLFYIFGGNVMSGQPVNDVWALNVSSSSSSSVWGLVHGDQNAITSEVNIANSFDVYEAGNTPSARSSIVFFLNQDYNLAQGMLIFGGVNVISEISFSDVWSFSTSLWEFKLVNGTSFDGNQEQVDEVSIGSRYSSLGGFSDYTNSLFIFGGEI